MKNEISAAVLIRDAWNLRFQSRLIETQKLAGQLAALNLSEAEHVELKLIEISLERGSGSLERADTLWEALRKELTVQKTIPSFQFYFQKGLNLFAAEDFSTALEFFLTAESFTETKELKLLCLINILTCMENLNLPSDRTCADLKRLLVGASGELSEIVATQFKAFQLRFSFRTGRMDEVFLPVKLRSFAQCHYYQLWISSLPYVQTPQFKRAALLENLTRTSSFYLKSYRLDTLSLSNRRQRLVGSVKGVPIPEQVDRLYLWTWSWLCGPGDETRDALRETLRTFDFKSALRKMTFEDFQLLRNALSWIALFQTHLRPKIQEYLAHFSVKSRESFPLYEYESLWIRSLQGENIASQISRHPIDRVEQIQIRKYAQPWLESRDSPSSDSERTNKLYVNAVTHQIISEKTRLISEPIAQILLAFRREEVHEFSGLLWLAFGIRRYDSGVHAVKMNNCLNRVRALLPKSVQIKTKNSKAYWVGPRDFLVQIAPSEHEKELLPSSDFKIGVRDVERRSFEVRLNPRGLLEIAGKRSLTRLEIQRALLLSKTHTNRWLSKWIKAGLIKRSGSGPRVRYLIDVTGE